MVDTRSSKHSHSFTSATFTLAQVHFQPTFLHCWPEAYIAIGIWARCNGRSLYQLQCLTAQLMLYDQSSPCMSYRIRRNADPCRCPPEKEKNYCCTAAFRYNVPIKKDSTHFCLLDPSLSVGRDDCIQWTVSYMTQSTKKTRKFNWPLLTDQRRSSDLFNTTIQFYILSWIPTVYALKCQFQLKDLVTGHRVGFLWSDSEKGRLDCSCSKDHSTPLASSALVELQRIWQEKK